MKDWTYLKDSVGQFWLPEAPAERRSGRIRFRPDGLTQIEIDKPFELDPRVAFDERNAPWILGVTEENDAISMEQCRGGLSRFASNSSRSMTRIRYDCAQLWAGIHVEAADNLKFQHCSVQLDGIEEWFPDRPFFAKHSPDFEPGDPWSVCVSLPTSLDIIVRGGTLSLERYAEGHIGIHEARIVPVTRLRLRFETPTDYSEILWDHVEYAVRFFEFSTKGTVAIHHLQFWNDPTDESRIRKYTLLTRDRGPASGEANEHLALLNPRTAQISLHTLFTRWMEERESLQQVLWSYRLVAAGQVEIAHGQLFFIVQALEGLHRLHRDRDRDRNAKETPLVERLKEYFAEVPAIKEVWQIEASKAAERVKNARHAITHIGERNRLQPDTLDTVWMTELCEAVIEQKLMEILGVPADIAGKHIVQYYQNRRSYSLAADEREDDE